MTPAWSRISCGLASFEAIGRANSLRLHPENKWGFRERLKILRSLRTLKDNFYSSVFKISLWFPKQHLRIALTFLIQAWWSFWTFIWGSCQPQGARGTCFYMFFFSDSLCFIEDERQMKVLKRAFFLKKKKKSRLHDISVSIVKVWFLCSSDFPILSLEGCNLRLWRKFWHRQWVEMNLFSLNSGTFHGRKLFSFAKVACISLAGHWAQLGHDHKVKS